MIPSASQALFAHVVNRPDDEIELDVAALLVGEWERDDLDVAHYLAMLDRIAAQAAGSFDQTEPLSAIDALNHVIFEQQGFRGNEDDYYDPRNSFLSAVLDRRTGIPITLSVIYIEVARRLGIPIKGVSFPGHFMVRYEVAEDVMLVIDPFRMGMVLSPDALQALLTSITGKRARLTPSLLAAANNRDILIRMLSNLASIYSKREDASRSIEVLERILILDPTKYEIEQELERIRSQLSEVN